MKIIWILVSLMFLVQVKGLIKECLYACKKIYKPVCAFNGYCYETFSNDCILKTKNCERRVMKKDGK